ncbi:MAG: 2,3-bisphosphoglycerate-independent phosphoglycerate mutase [Chitinophagaceae bacterium]
MPKKSMLIIMDGWGHGQVPASDAIRHANTPNVSSYYHQYPNSELITCGEAVGLPEGQMGNSEVGHLNIGAGRIVYQELQRINVAIRSGEMASNTTFQAMLDYAKTHAKPLHLLGLVSDGGVHAHIEHLKAICDLCMQAQLPAVYIHVITDGRDTDPKSGLGFLRELEAHIAGTVCKVATVCGRFYAMDRDKRWERVKVAYDAFVHAQGEHTQDASASLAMAYENGITDEFLKPLIVCNADGQAVASIQEKDAVFCFNFRTDRCREITQVLTQEAFHEQNMHPLNLHYVTMTEYDKTFKDVQVLFRNDDLRMTLGEVLEQAGRTQIRIAETEKYPHVTFFFSGGREKEFTGERRIMLASPKDVPTYDLKPEMSAFGITEAIIPEIQQQSADFICLNFANADMVGHTGVWEAAIKAAETVDTCVGRIVEEALKQDYTVFLTADHGNSDFLVNEDGTPNTAHTLNPVPFFIISNDYKGIVRSGKLGDIAPTILHCMGIGIPNEMSGEVLMD